MNFTSNPWNILWFIIVVVLLIWVLGKFGII